MKKIDLIHTTVLIIALLVGYSDIYHLQSGITGGIVFDLLGIILLGACCAILIKKGRSYAAAILKNEPEASGEETAMVQLDRRNLVFVLLIGMGLYTLIQSFPHLLADLFERFQNKIAVEQVDYGGILYLFRAGPDTFH